MAIASAERLLSDGRYAEAVRVADAALDADPTNTFARQFRAWAHMASGAFALALADYGECLKERPADPTVLIDRAWTHVQRQDMPMAVRDLTTAISSQGEDDAPAFAYWLRAVALRRQGNLQGALDDLDRAVQLDNEADVEYRLSRAGVHCQLGQLAPARSDLEWVAERDPDNPTLLDLEQYAAMLSDDATRVALPHAAGRHAHRAWASVISNDYVKALEPDAEHNEADETALCMAQSVALLGAGRPRAALDTVNRALIKSPTCAVLLYVRGRAYRQLDLPSQALANFRQACALDPQLTIAQQAAQLVEHELRAAITSGHGLRGAAPATNRHR
ncbi:Tetratricopeptide repeat protein [Plasmodiophora brassicae]|uniref:Tetratricopeptide repeat protein n=1 Tax=Plasmodiophora brassicae TaxID=37360 RepID=A0A0G4ITX3_PLABS|nr:hypothetical protein PBRA_006897 [Plasmodiophora brassicae]